MCKALEINGLTKKYSDFSLNNINFSLETGSIMGFIGENGAGKTTTIKLILNLIKRNSGSIKVFGLDNIQDEQKIKEQIGVVFDEGHIHGLLSLKQVDKIMPKIYLNWNKKLFDRYIFEFNLPKDKEIEKFSRGMKMKLSIAIALAHEPKLLLLDEATAGLDPVVRNEILDVFREFIQDEQHSILMSSHITSDLEKISDYVTFLHQGNVILTGNKDEILEQYGVAKCARDEVSKVDSKYIIGLNNGDFGSEFLVSNKEEFRNNYPKIIVDNANLEEIMLHYVKEEK
ncbi:MAG: ABC transporter ATP-binding protein [Oscillospiraceae bacterium]